MRVTVCLCLAGLALGASLPAVAGDTAGPAPTSLFDQVIPATDLNTLRGGQEYHINDMDVNAHLYDNVTSNVATGNNAVTNGSLTGNNGFATVIQNSGNNVIIQSATILNLNVQ